MPLKAADLNTSKGRSQQDAHACFPKRDVTAGRDPVASAGIGERRLVLPISHLAGSTHPARLTAAHLRTGISQSELHRCSSVQLLSAHLLVCHRVVMRHPSQVSW
ncbi:hypothetical protein NDU88_007532 [Pleurodeles waltl]|uniref:Uncharacterized protein n=1 Tax=Pleurodeles waltl TaxID=8319 RepID=A0AAV7PPA6_PLEWA|nr:hypothetical protein NDU88_007532 [Pleurodeles waltl]